ncbi:MAG: hypothetical protein JHC25_04055 [Thermodesulfobacterium sp.]|nr:hypothetical protein [Thermodesulfobacterium sp.]
MDRKDLLVRLSLELLKLTDAYGDCVLCVDLGERLMWFGSVFSKIGWILVWGEEEDKEKMFQVIEDAIKKKREHKINCSLEEWLGAKLQEIENEIYKRMHPEEIETPSQQQEEEDELPF